MPRLLAALLLFTAACSSGRPDDTSDDTTDAGSTTTTDAGTTTPDAGTTTHDAGTTTHDAGTTTTPDAGTDACATGTCGETDCADISGSYVACATCPALGTRGPFETTVVRVGTTCEFEVTTSQSPSSSACASACAAPVGGITTTYTIQSFSLQCSGTTGSGGAEMTCPTALGACTYTWLPAGTTSCQ